jgi:PIN domain nuclease of toxin-antitoxin system
MRYLWDTHALIFGMDGDPELPEAARSVARRGGNCISSISLWEVSALVFKGRIRLKLPVAEWLEEVARRLEVIPVTPWIAAKAYDLGEFHGDPADRLIAATALVYPATIVTRDAKLTAHPGLSCLWD